MYLGMLAQGPMQLANEINPAEHFTMVGRAAFLRFQGSQHPYTTQTSMIQPSILKQDRVQNLDPAAQAGCRWLPSSAFGQVPMSVLCCTKFLAREPTIRSNINMHLCRTIT